MPSFDPMKTLSLAAALAFSLSPAASAQTAPVADCGPISGTIRVADDARITPDMARVSEADARAAAQRVIPGATVTDLDLDDEDGYLVYEADLWRDGVEFDVTIDAGNGEVLCTEQD